MIERILVVLLGLALAFTSLHSHETEKRLDGERMFWRTMYRAAEKDAKYKRCLELDDNFVICEKP